MGSFPRTQIGSCLRLKIPPAPTGAAFASALHPQSPEEGMRGVGMFTSQSIRYTCVHTCTHSASGYTRQADEHRLRRGFL